MSTISGLGAVQGTSIQGLDLESALMAVQSNRANLLEAQLKDQIAGVQAKNDQISRLNQAPPPQSLPRLYDPASTLSCRDRLPS
jgi:hypothetical protein